MREVTLFISLTQYAKDNSVCAALKSVGAVIDRTCGKLVEEGVEADFAITNSTAMVLRWLKETKNTFIVYVYYPGTDEEIEKAKDFASSFSGGRVSAVPYINLESGEPGIVPYLFDLIKRKPERILHEESADS